MPQMTYRSVFANFIRKSEQKNKKSETAAAAVASSRFNILFSQQLAPIHPCG